MKKISLIFVLFLFLSPVVWAGNSACLQSLKGFICKDPTGKAVMGRCAKAKQCYDLQENNQAFRCCPVGKTTNTAKKNLIALIKTSDSVNLEQFKQSCDYASPVNFRNDWDVQAEIKSAINFGHVEVIRALIYAQSHCVNIHSKRIILSWLGNELLHRHTENLIQALSDENEKEDLNKIAPIETNEWRKLKCKNETCQNNRRAYFISKKTSLENAKISAALEPIRQEMIQSLSSSIQ